MLRSFLLLHGLAYQEVRKLSKLSGEAGNSVLQVHDINNSRPAVRSHSSLSVKRSQAWSLPLQGAHVESEAEECAHLPSPPFDQVREG